MRYSAENDNFNKNETKKISCLKSPKNKTDKYLLNSLQLDKHAKKIPNKTKQIMLYLQS